MNLKYRQEIDGLRAIAIMSVFIYHAFPDLMPGGFIGVDIFFVISGFLISSAIFSEIDSAEFKFADFYSRRTRRIFPALIVVACFTYLTGFYVLTPDEFAQLGRNIAAGATFTLNFLLQGQTGYFDKAADYSPVLHLWSLCIEEQFYLIIPVLFLLGFIFKLKRFYILTFIFLASFASNIYYLNGQATSAFYFPISRFWELILGAMLAHWINYLPKEKGFIVSATGLTLILFGVFFINKDNVYPSWITFVPCIGALMILSVSEDNKVNHFLKIKPMVWMGVISYPLYLWHYPIFSFVRIYYGSEPEIEVIIFFMIISVLCAWATYKYVEFPVRFGRLRRVNSIIVIGFLLGSLLTVAVVSRLTAKFDGFPNRWGIDKILNSQQEDYNAPNTYKCELNVDWGKDAGCQIMDLNKPPTIALIGDSHAGHFKSALVNYASGKNENVITFSGAGCVPFLGVRTRRQPNLEEHCKNFVDKFFYYIDTNTTIKTVVLSTRGVISITGKTFGVDDAITRYIDSDDYPSAKDARALFEVSLRNTISHLQRNNVKVVFILDNPELGFNPTSCMDLPLLRLKKLNCAVGREIVESRNEDYRNLVFSVAKDFKSLYLVDSFEKLCDDRFCYGMKNGHRIYHDSNHLTPYGADLVGSTFTF